MSCTVSTAFAQLDFIQTVVPSNSVRKLCHHGLNKYLPQNKISCNDHEEICRKKVISTIINVFYNNKQHRSSDEVRKQQIVSFKKHQRGKEQHDISVYIVEIFLPIQAVSTLPSTYLKGYKQQYQNPNFTLRA